MSSPVTLAASGLPNLATASFNPPTVPPSAAPTTFTLTIATPETTAFSRAQIQTWAFVFLPFFGFFGFGRACRPGSRSFTARFPAAALLAITLVFATGCGDRVNVASAAATAASESYTITVTGTSTTSTGSTLQHSTTVTLILQPAS